MVEKSLFQMYNNEEIHKVRITNERGEFVEILDFGATIYSINVLDKNGNLRDVALGYDTIEEYFNAGTCFGATVGRVANRISGARFTLNGETYNLFDNTGSNVTLHGGKIGWQKKKWTIKSLGDDSATFSYYSDDGEENFPGDISINVTITFTDDAELRISYYAVSDEDTPFNVTNHSYFNLDGHNADHNILKTLLKINSTETTPLGDDFTPTGEFVKIPGTVYDFTKPTPIGLHINDDDAQLKLAGGYDINYVITGSGMRVFAKALSLESGITLTCSSDMPCMQLYVGNFIENNSLGKGGSTYNARQGFCLETQNFPDAMNKPFPDYLLKKYETFTSETIYKFGTL